MENLSFNFRNLVIRNFKYWHISIRHKEMRVHFIDNLDIMMLGPIIRKQ